LHVTCTAGAASYPNLEYLINTNLQAMEPYFWTCFVHHLEKYMLQTLAADTRTQTGGTQADMLCKVVSCKLAN